MHQVFAKNQTKIGFCVDECTSLKRIAEVVHQMAVEKGWWPSEYEPQGLFPEKIALIHSELSEALEEYRRPGVAFEEIYYLATGKPEGATVELADAIIRILDLCERYELPILRALDEKIRHNADRPKRHGGKRC